MSRSRRSATLLALFVVAALSPVAAACGTDEPAADDATTSTNMNAEGVPEPEDGPATTASQPGGGVDTQGGGAVVAATSSSLGELLVDGEGRTLYLFTPDDAGPSTCVDACAEAWPPLLTTGAPNAGTGATLQELGTTERPDGTVQVTYNGWPLYLFAGDGAPGDINGQGSGGVWFVVGPTGEAVRTGGSGGGSGY